MREAIISKTSEVPPAMTGTASTAHRKYSRIFAAATGLKKGALRVDFGTNEPARLFYNTAKVSRCWSKFGVSLRGNAVYLTKGGK